jgi:hypothetical protein
MDEADDYADRDLPPPRPWVRFVLPVMAAIVLSLGMLAGGVFWLLSSLQRFD